MPPKKRAPKSGRAAATADDEYENDSGSDDSLAQRDADMGKLLLKSQRTSLAMRHKQRAEIEAGFEKEVAEFDAEVRGRMDDAAKHATRERLSVLTRLEKALGRRREVELKILAEMEELKHATDTLARYVADVVAEVEGAVQDRQDVEMEG